MLIEEYLLKQGYESSLTEEQKQRIRQENWNTALIEAKNTCIKVEKYLNRKLNYSDFCEGYFALTDKEWDKIPESIIDSLQDQRYDIAL